MAIGNVQGLDYALPQQRYIGQQASGAAPAGVAPQIGLPDLNDDYANVQGITDEFINTVGQLKSYTHDMAKKYKIDVTEPDYAQPGGGQPYRTFQELSAKAILTGKDLKKRMTDNTAIQTGYLKGEVLPQGDYENAPLDASIQERATPLNILEDVRLAAQALSRPYDTKAGADRANLTIRDPLKAKYTQLIKDDPDNAAFYQRQIDSIPTANWEPPQFNPNTGDGPKKNNGAILIKEITNIAQGRWKPGDYTKSTDENGDPVFINKARNGRQYGEFPITTGVGPQKQERKVKRILDHWEKKSDGSVWAVFQQTEKGHEIPPQRVDNINSGSVAEGFFSNVTSYGRALEEAQVEGWVDEAGFVDYDKVPSEDYTTPDIAEDKKKTDTAKTEIRKSLTTATKDKPLVLQVGDKKIEIKPNSWGKGHYIEVNGVELDENLSEKDLFKYLKEEGYFDQVVNSAPAATQPGTPQPTAKFKTKAGQVVDYAKLQQIATNGGYPSVEEYIKRNGLTPAE